MSNPRELWRPKMPELSEQCVSCPFRNDNDAELAEVMGKLREKHGIKGKVKKRDVAYLRYKVLTEDIAHTGDFACHHTAYDYANGMQDKPRSAHRQCPGAAAEYKRQGAQT
jgi:hypothetical protein